MIDHRNDGHVGAERMRHSGNKMQVNESFMSMNKI